MPRTNTRPRRPASVKAAARHADVSDRTIRRRIGDGSLRAWRLGPKLIKVDLDDVDRLFDYIPAARNGHRTGS